MPILVLTCFLVASQVPAEDSALVDAGSRSGSIKEFDQLSNDDLAAMSLEDLLAEVKVSTSSKIESSFERSPSILAIFSRAELDMMGARQLSDLLPFIPGFFEVASPLDRNFAVRGIHASLSQHFVVLLDGLRVNDLLFANASPDGISLEHAQRVEVVRGPGSAIYGANALMAVINIITAKPKETGARASITGGAPTQLRLDARMVTQAGEKRVVQVSGSVWGRRGTRFGVGSEEDILLPSLGANVTDGLQPGENLTNPPGAVTLSINRYSPSFDFLVKVEEEDSWAVRVGASRNDYFPQRTSRQNLFNPGSSTVAPQYLKERLLVDIEKRLGQREGLGQLTVRPSFQMFNHVAKSQVVGADSFLEASRQNAPVITGWSGRDFSFMTTVDYLKEFPAFWILSDNSLIVGAQAELNVLDDYRARSCRLDLENRLPPSI
ncbi:MAG: TonB-dependent receptor plug domain-containing protein, partial [Myxococcaceae bacterium]